MNPRIAPTTMNTVPSGNLLTCMYGALAVGGTDGATIVYAPDKVGRLVGRAVLPVPVPVIDGIVPVSDIVEPPVMLTVLAPELDPVADVTVALPVADEDCESVAVERLGSALVEAAPEPMAKTETATATANSVVLR